MNRRILSKLGIVIAALLFVSLFALGIPGESTAYVIAANAEIGDEALLTASQPFTSTPSSAIQLTGLAANNNGVASWNADGSGPEGPALGHVIPAPYGDCLGPNNNALYYIASRDYDGIDPTSTGALQGAGGISGFPSLTTALADNGFTAEDLTMKFSVASLGNDVEGEDWFFDEAIETRIYSGGTFMVQLDGEDVVGGDMPNIIVTVNYNDPANCTDDITQGTTESVIPEDLSATSSADVQAVAEALLADIGQQGIKFTFDSFTFASDQPLFQGNGRGGVLSETQSGQIELMPVIVHLPIIMDIQAVSAQDSAEVE